jgi:hypothetical protein
MTDEQHKDQTVLEKELNDLFTKAKTFPSTEPMAIKLAEIGAVVLTKDGIVLYPMGKAPSALPPTTPPATPPAQAPPAQTPPPAAQPTALETELKDLKAKMADLTKAKTDLEAENQKLKAPAPPKQEVKNGQEEKLSDKHKVGLALRNWFVEERNKANGTPPKA